MALTFLSCGGEIMCFIEDNNGVFEDDLKFILESILLEQETVW